jgi:uncharacterized protein YjbI with pentapeptide repeats
MAKEDEQKPGQKQPEGERKFNQKQYDMLKRCSDKKDMTEWNQWRKENPDEKIRLEAAHLEKANLRYAYLEDAILGEAHLENAELFSAHLENAILCGAQLENATLQGAQLENATLFDANLVNSNLQGAYLEHADLQYAHLENADLHYAHLENADLHYAHLENANLRGTHLENSDCCESNLKGTEFNYTSLEGASFVNSIVDGNTLFVECELDRKTDFRRVGLDSARIGPATKQLLEYNARRMNWEEWYKEHWFLQWPVKLFWSFSDYGKSTWRIIGWFFFLSLAFAAIYANCACWWPPGIVNNLEVEPHLPLWHYFLLVLLRPVYFSIVTMTTLGFGDMHANESSIWGHVLLTFQVILGYVLLGALVTRFAVLFTAGGPAGKFAPTKTKEKGII